MRLQVLPAVRGSDIAGRALRPRNGTCQRQGAVIPLRKQHRRVLKFAHPARIVAAVISQMRREQDVKAIIRQGAFLRVKLNLLQNSTSVGISHYLLFYAVMAITTSVDQLEGRHTVGQPFHFVAGIAFLFGEKLRAVRDNQSHVTNTGLVNSRPIYLV